MTKLAVVLFIPFCLVLGNPLGPQNDWANEYESFTLGTDTERLEISTPADTIKDNFPISMPPLNNFRDSTNTIPAEPTFNEIMKVIEDRLNEIEASEMQKQATRINVEDKLKQLDKVSPMQKVASTTTGTTGSDEDGSSSSESDETSTEISTAQSADSEFSSVEDDSEDGKLLHNKTESKKKSLIQETISNKNYADKFKNYIPMTTVIPKDSISGEMSTSTTEYQITTEQTNTNYEGINQLTENRPEISNDEKDKSTEIHLHHILLSKDPTNDMMDKVIFDNQEASPNNEQTGVHFISIGEEQTQPKYNIFVRPSVSQPDEVTSSNANPMDAELTTRLLPPKPYSDKTNYWTMYPEIPERNLFQQSMLTRNQEIMRESQLPQSHSPNFYPYQYQHYQPTRAMPIQMSPIISPFQNFRPQTYSNNYNYQMTQMYPQQMYQGNPGSGYYGDYYSRSPYWTRPRSSSAYNSPSYWNSYRYNNNNGPMFNEIPMLGSQYYY